MNEVIKNLLSTPQGQALVAAATALGLVVLTQLVKFIYAKRTSNQLAKEVIYITTFVFANLATLSAMALNYLPMLKGTRYEQIAFSLTGLAIGLHTLATSKPFQKANVWWSDFQAGRATRKAVGPVLATADVSPVSPLPQFPANSEVYAAASVESVPQPTTPQQPIQL